MKLIAGLGNPGPKYAATRHNIGFLVAEAFAGRHDLALKRRGHEGVYGVGRACGQELTVLLPQTYMNRSGASVRSACSSLGLDLDDLIVIHDDIDLPFGRIRLKQGGGHGGHNGLRHITEVMGSGEFVRVRVGVGRPVLDGDVSSHVLGAFGAGERRELQAVVDGAVEALEALLARGLTAAMNDYNNRDLSIAAGGSDVF